MKKNAFLEISDKEYFSSYKVLSQSSIKEGLRDHRTIFQKNNKIEVTESMMIGTLCHSIILQGNLDDYKVSSYKTRSSQKFKDQNTENNYCTEKEIASAKLISKNAINQLQDIDYLGVDLVSILKDCIIENAIFFDVEESDICDQLLFPLPGKAKIDCFQKNSTTIFDLKITSSDIYTDKKLLHTIMDWKYYIQSYWYRLAVSKTGICFSDIRFIFIFVSSKPPYTVRMVELTDQWDRYAKNAISKVAKMAEKKILNIQEDILFRGISLFSPPAYME